MRTILLSALSVLLSALGLFAQPTAPALSPAELVQTYRGMLDRYPATTLLQPTAARNLVALELNDDYLVLETEAEALEALRHQAPMAFRMALPLPDGSNLQLELVKVELTTPDFTVLESSGGQAARLSAGGAVHYRGVVADEPGSVVAFSFWNGELAALVSTPGRGNLSLGKLPASAARDGHNAPPRYVLYNDREVLARERFHCDTPDDGIAYQVEMLREPATGRSPGDCVRVYFEVDHDIYLQKGGTTAAVDYVTALFNQVATLYASENVSVLISQVYVWNTPSPYAGTSSHALLTQFQQVRTSFNGDIAQLLSYKGSGGIAVLAGLCHPATAARMSFSSINSTFNTVPTYSFSVMVVAHELGHLLGSQHTHACVWNGNGTAIDGCAGFVEGSCAVPTVPSGGGTIMSYCHITQAGINFSRGFGPQPGAVIRNRINAATCLQACATGGGGGGGGNPPPTAGCTQNELFLRLTLDDYGPETTWELRDAQNSLIDRGGPYPKAQAGRVVLDTFCLPNGCFTFKLLDSYGDGICCQYGNGGYLLRNAAGQTLASGGEFGSEAVATVCLPHQPGDNAGCTTINFNDHEVQSYGVNQDIGQHTVQDNGQTLFIQNNAWKALDLDYTITPNTVLKFDFRSTLEGEIHGIGFDDDDQISYNLTFKVHGTQLWGITNFDNYPGDGGWRSYSIPVGQFYTGLANRLFFAADHDGSPRNGNAWFRNVRISEGDACGSSIVPGGAIQLAGEPGAHASVRVWPNPADGLVQLQVNQPATGAATWEITTLTGQVLQSHSLEVSDSHSWQQQINTSALPAGSYLLRWRDEAGERTTRLVVGRR